jgi:hypothetical protein
MYFWEQVHSSPSSVPATHSSFSSHPQFNIFLSTA